MAELVDALVSGTSEVTLVEVQVLSSAPKKITQEFPGLFSFLLKIDDLSEYLRKK